MKTDLPVLCIGSALWDIIAQADRHMHKGADLPGRINRRMGGVALNVALALAAQGCPASLLSVVGEDDQGDHLVREAAARGVSCAHITRSTDPTDTYLAVEDPDGEVFAAIADCAALERAGARLLAPLRDGRLGSAQAPWRGRMVIDGNLPAEILTSLAHDDAFRAADIAFVPASPGKADRLRAAIVTQKATVYVNRTEAEVLCLARFTDAVQAAEGLIALGAGRAIVTNGPHPVADATSDRCLTMRPPTVEARTTTGAGDAFMAAHIAAELRGITGRRALLAAATAAAAHIMPTS